MHTGAAQASRQAGRQLRAQNKGRSIHDALTRCLRLHGWRKQAWLNSRCRFRSGRLCVKECTHLHGLCRPASILSAQLCCRTPKAGRKMANQQHAVHSPAVKRTQLSRLSLGPSGVFGAG